MDTRIFLFIVVGAALMGAVGLERLLKRLPFPLPMPLVYIAAGYFVFALPFGVAPIDVIGNDFHSLVTEYLTEFIVIASLLAAGIAIDRPFSWHGWAQVNRLVILAPSRHHCRDCSARLGLARARARLRHPARGHSRPDRSRARQERERRSAGR